MDGNNDDSVIILDGNEEPEDTMNAQSHVENAEKVTNDDKHWKDVKDFIENNPLEVKKLIVDEMFKQLDERCFTYMGGKNDKPVTTPTNVPEEPPKMDTQSTSDEQQSSSSLPKEDPINNQDDDDDIEIVEEIIKKPISSLVATNLPIANEKRAKRPKRVHQFLSANQSFHEALIIEENDVEEGMAITGELDDNEGSGYRGDLMMQVFKPGAILREGRQFRQHECDNSCVYQDISMDQLKGYNPYSWPLLVGWKRQILTREVPTKYNQPTDDVYYVSPCGRTLRTIEDIKKFLDKSSNPFGIEVFTFEVPFEVFKPSLPILHPCFTFKEDISFGQENQPISLINFLADEPLDPTWIYSSSRFPGPGVDESNFSLEFSSCCDCTDNCSDSTKCSCQKLTYDGYDLVEGLRSNFPSSKRGYKNKLLEEAARFGIYECNQRCPCNSHCPNRVVQLGIRVLLQVFKTTKKGWGVRTLHDIPKGAFVSVYSAELLSEDAADEKDAGDEYFANLDLLECVEQTKKDYEDAPTVDLTSSEDDDKDMDDDDDDQLFTPDSEDSNPLPVPQRPKQDRTRRWGRKPLLAKWTGFMPSPAAKKCPSPEKPGRDRKTMREELYGANTTYLLDAKFKGNVGRFFNHSCNANIFVQNVFIDNHDFRFPIVAFFTSRMVNAMEEITWNYQYEKGSVPGRVMECFCRSMKCEGRLL